MERASRSRAGFRPYKGLTILSRENAGGKESTRSGNSLPAPRALECVPRAPEAPLRDQVVYFDCETLARITADPDRIVVIECAQHQS